jgi:hypothetical protein
MVHDDKASSCCTKQQIDVDLLLAKKKADAFIWHDDDFTYVVAFTEDVSKEIHQKARAKLWFLNDSTTNLWNKCTNTVHDSCWFYTAKIRALKATKMYWPHRGFWKHDGIWVLSVDDTHLLTLEPGESDIPKDPSYFSFKHHAAGLNYKVGVCLFQSRCISG